MSETITAAERERLAKMCEAEAHNRKHDIHGSAFDWRTIASILRAPTERDVCSACVGKGTPISGGPCICGGRGTLQAEADGLRRELYDLRTPTSPVGEPVAWMWRYRDVSETSDRKWGQFYFGLRLPFDGVLRFMEREDVPLYRAAPTSQPIGDERRVYLCTLCHENPVDVENGYDTCDACLHGSA